MSDNKETKRNRATMAPGGCECSKCGCIFIGGETHTECGICANEPKQAWAPERIWLQRGVGDDGSHTWCSDSQDEHEEAEYVRIDVQAPAAEAGARDERVSMIQTLMLDWINARAGKEALAVWNRIEEKLAALARESDTQKTLPAWVFDNLIATLQPAFDYVQTHQEQFGALAGDDKAKIIADEFLRHARASEAAAGETVPTGWKLVPVKSTPEMQQAFKDAYKGGSIWTDRIDYALEQFITAAPQPASKTKVCSCEFDAWQANPYTKVLQKSITEDYVPKASGQQPVPQVFTDNDDAAHETFGKTVFAGMSNSDDLWTVWIDGWQRAREQQAARVLSDEQRRILLRVSECLYVAGYQMIPGELASAFSAILAAKGDGHAD